MVCCNDASNLLACFSFASHRRSSAQEVLTEVLSSPHTDRRGSRCANAAAARSELSLVAHIREQGAAREVTASSNNECIDATQFITSNNCYLQINKLTSCDKHDNLSQTASL